MDTETQLTIAAQALEESIGGQAACLRAVELTLEALRGAVPAGRDAAFLLDRYERQWHRMGELWERYQGKGWPDVEGAEFESLRDEKSPRTRAALIAMLAAAPQPAQGEKQ